jgi:hypothetical protein
MEEKMKTIIKQSKKRFCLLKGVYFSDWQVFEICGNCEFYQRDKIFNNFKCLKQGIKEVENERKTR